MTAPIKLVTSDSPIICRTILLVFQPIALSVPNSRILRVTPEVVNKIAIKKATNKTIIESHLLKAFTNVEAELNEPERF